MPIRTFRRSPFAPSRWALLIAITATGCGPGDQVSKYTAPKDPADAQYASDMPTEGETKVRVLGAIAEAGKPGEPSWYFFKLQGPKSTDTYSPAAVERHAADFGAFIDSLKFPPDGPPTWTVPTGWRAVEVKTQFPRIATLRAPRKSETV